MKLSHLKMDNCTNYAERLSVRFWSLSKILFLMESCIPSSGQEKQVLHWR